MSLLRSRNGIRRKNKNSKNRRITKINHVTGEVTYALPMSRTIVPDSLISNLKWVDSSHYVLNNALSSFATIRFRPSGVYDIDPVLGSTAVPGYNELTSLYGKYRTISSRIRVNFTNLEKFPVQVFVWPTNFDLGANYAQVASAMSSPFAKNRTISSSGGMDHALLTHALDTSQIFGTDEVLYDDQFAASITTVPANNWFWNVGIWSPTNTLVNGVMTLIEIDVTVQFTERIHLTA